MKQGEVKGSMVEFDKTLELDPRQRPCAVINFCMVVSNNNVSLNFQYYKLVLNIRCLLPNLFVGFTLID